MKYTFSKSVSAAFFLISSAFGAAFDCSECTEESCKDPSRFTNCKSHCNGTAHFANCRKAKITAIGASDHITVAQARREKWLEDALNASPHLRKFFDVTQPTPVNLTDLITDKEVIALKHLLNNFINYSIDRRLKNIDKLINEHPDKKKDLEALRKNIDTLLNNAGAAVPKVKAGLTVIDIKKIVGPIQMDTKTAVMAKADLERIIQITELSPAEIKELKTKLAPVIKGKTFIDSWQSFLDTILPYAKNRASARVITSILLEWYNKDPKTLVYAQYLYVMDKVTKKIEFSGANKTDKLDKNVKKALDKIEKSQLVSERDAMVSHAVVLYTDAYMANMPVLDLDSSVPPPPPAIMPRAPRTGTTHSQSSPHH